MIDRRSQGISHLHAIFLGVEAVGLWIAMAASSRWISIYSYYSLLDPWTYWIGVGGAVMVVTWALAVAADNLVRLGWVGATQLALRQIVCVACAVFAIAVATKDVGLSRVFLVNYFTAAFVVLVLGNRYQPAFLARFFICRDNKVPMLLMGRAENFPGLEGWLEEQKILGLEAVGLLDYHGAVSAVKSLPVVGSFDGLEEALRNTHARQVLMLELPRSTEDMERLARCCAERGCRMMVHNNLVVQIGRPLRAMAHHGHSFLVLHDEPLESALNRFLKRVLDVGLALPVLVLVLPPLMLGVKLAQVWQSPGPLFYRQTRTGRNGRPFAILKFRTMHAAFGGNLEQARRGDQRVFPLGRLLRQTSLDEMPQFINVLIGNMSVVGPRPHLGEQEGMFAKSAEIYRMRLLVKPGITGLAQSRGFRGEAKDPDEIRERIRLDLMYIRGWSLWLDVAIICRTFVAVVRPPRSAC